MTEHTYKQFVGTGDLGGRDAFNHFVVPGNVLKGFSTLINVASGQAVGAEPTVFANFRTVGGSDTMIFPPGDLQPDLGFVNPSVASYVDDRGNLAEFEATGVSTAVDAVSALLMRRNVINEFTSTAAGTTQTDWVLTFPTKHHYTDGGGLAANTSRAPFDEAFSKAPDNLLRHDGKSCVDIGPTYYNREEATQVGSGTDFSPRPAGSRVELCNEVNVLSFNNSNVFGSGVRFAINTGSVGDTGWMNLRMGQAGDSNGVIQSGAEGRLFGYVGDDGVTMQGLPVIGFGAVVRFNDAEAGNNRNYGVAEEHSYNREVVITNGD